MRSRREASFGSADSTTLSTSRAADRNSSSPSNRATGSDGSSVIASTPPMRERHPTGTGADRRARETTATNLASALAYFVLGGFGEGRGGGPGLPRGCGFAGFGGSGGRGRGGGLGGGFDPP